MKTLPSRAVAQGWVVPGTLEYIPLLSTCRIAMADYMAFDKWPKAAQDGQILSAYSASVRLGFVWC